MALRQFFGFSDGELMRSDCKPCSRLVRQTAGLFTVGGALGFWVLCRLHYGPRITVPRSLRWASCGAISDLLFLNPPLKQFLSVAQLRNHSLHLGVVSLVEHLGAQLLEKRPPTQPCI